MAAKSFKRINPVLEIIGRDYEEVREVPIDEIKTGRPFVELFAIKDDVYEAILSSIKESGYDKAQPLIVWRQQDILIDGHTRLKAAREEGIKNLDYIPIIEKSFDSEEAALDYMYRLQFARRNIKDGELVQLAMAALEKY
jgi:ParB-like chromosome segregation protein Spo0J